MTMARVKDEEVVEVGLPDDLLDATSGRLHHYGWRKVLGKPKPVDGDKYEYGEPYSFDAEEDCVYGTWNKIPEFFLIEKRSKSIRNQRDSLLKESDWTQVIDSPVDKQLWADYRQALRDLPQQDGFPLEAEWPTPPA